MMRPIATTAAAAIASALFVGTIAAPAADAVTTPRSFANCTQLNGVYPHGVGKTGARDEGKSKTFRPVTTFRRDNAIYQANRKLDRDHDGVACEKR